MVIITINNITTIMAMHYIIIIIIDKVVRYITIMG